MRPDLVLDEATAMLDPEARHEVMALYKRLKKKKLRRSITHHMEEALLADLVYVISDGSIAFTAPRPRCLARSNGLSKRACADAS